MSRSTRARKSLTFERLCDVLLMALDFASFTCIANFRGRREGLTPGKEHVGHGTRGWLVDNSHASKGELGGLTDAGERCSQHLGVLGNAQVPAPIYIRLPAQHELRAKV